MRTIGRKLSVCLVTGSLILSPFAPSALAAGKGVGKEKVEQKQPAAGGQQTRTEGATPKTKGAEVKTESTETKTKATRSKAEIKAAAEQEIAAVKAESRAQARAERQNGAKDTYLVYVNGKRLNLTPLARSGKTLVPFRRLAETLGADVEWEPSTRTVTMIKGDQTVTLVIGATTAVVNGEEVEMGLPSEIVEGSTFVPLRFISEALGADVDYDPETGAITVVGDETGDDEAGEDEAGDDEAGEDAAGDDEAADDEAGEDQAADDEAGDDQAGDDQAGDDEAADDEAGDDQAADDEAADDQAADDGQAADDAANTNNSDI